MVNFWLLDGHSKDDPSRRSQTWIISYIKSHPIQISVRNILLMTEAVSLIPTCQRQLTEPTARSGNRLAENCNAAITLKTLRVVGWSDLGTHRIAMEARYKRQKSSPKFSLRQTSSLSRPLCPIQPHSAQYAIQKHPLRPRNRLCGGQQCPEYVWPLRHSSSLSQPRREYCRLTEI